MCKLRLALVLLPVILFAACTVWDKPATGWSGVTGGEQLEKLFWDDVKAKNTKSLDQHIAATFAGSGSTGPQDRAAFMQQLQYYQLRSVTLADCSSKLNGDSLVITCVVHREGMANGQALPTATAATLSVWQQLKKGWVMVAHAENPLMAARP